MVSSNTFPHGYRLYEENFRRLAFLPLATAPPHPGTGYQLDFYGRDLEQYWYIDFTRGAMNFNFQAFKGFGGRRLTRDSFYLVQDCVHGIRVKTFTIRQAEEVEPARLIEARPEVTSELQQQTQPDLTRQDQLQIARNVVAMVRLAITIVLTS